MKTTALKMLRVTAALSLVLSLSLMAGHSQAQNAGTGPIFVDGQAQVVRIVHRATLTDPLDRPD